MKPSGRAFIVALSIAISILMVVGVALGQETLLPQNYNITVNYSMNTLNFEQNGTAWVTKIVTNNESFPLTGMYMTECVLRGLTFEPIYATLNGTPIDFYVYGPLTNELLPNFNVYRMVFDFPDQGGPNNIINPGQNLRMLYKIVQNPPSGFYLPFHTTCFYGAGTGFFTTADTVYIPSYPLDVPTLDQWGLLLTALLIIALATVLLIRKRPAVETKRA